jgi:hypothetical protein
MSNVSSLVQRFEVRFPGAPPPEPHSRRLLARPSGWWARFPARSAYATAKRSAIAQAPGRATARRFNALSKAHPYCRAAAYGARAEKSGFTMTLKYASTPRFRAIIATSGKKRLWGLPIPHPIHSVAASIRLFLSVHVNASLPESWGEILMLKFVILGVASLAFVGTAVAADLPRPQPVAAAPAPVGKYPVGKYPVGKSPVGKYPVAAPAPVVTKG